MNPSTETPEQQKSAAGTSKVIAGKDERLEVLSESPLVLETPLSLLAGSPITPKSQLFVRNARDLPQALTLEPLPLAGWRVELSGMIDRPVTIGGEDLLNMEQAEVEMVLQCSGNSRSRFSESSPIPGTPWGQGGVANVRFAGVPLSTILREHNVRIDPEANFVTAAGKDPALCAKQPNFEHSLPFTDVLDRAMLAIKLNGESLPGIHGGPLRLVAPGFYGTMQVKWLEQLRFEKTESTSYYHAMEYRVPKRLLQPGEDFEFTLDNSVPTWKLRLMSFIFSPQRGQELKAGALTFSGVAFNDGATPLAAVLVSFDRSQSWRRAVLEIPQTPYGWYPWTLETELKPGVHQVWCRAFDALGRTQPLDGTTYWNPNGYEWNGVHKIEVIVG
jgi:sulfite oxidase